MKKAVGGTNTHGPAQGTTIGPSSRPQAGIKIMSSKNADVKLTASILARLAVHPKLWRVPEHDQARLLRIVALAILDPDTFALMDDVDLAARLGIPAEDLAQTRSRLLAASLVDVGSWAPTLEATPSAVRSRAWRESRKAKAEDPTTPPPDPSGARSALASAREQGPCARSALETIRKNDAPRPRALESARTRSAGDRERTTSPNLVPGGELGNADPPASRTPAHAPALDGGIGLNTENLSIYPKSQTPLPPSANSTADRAILDEVSEEVAQTFIGNPKWANLVYEYADTFGVDGSAYGWRQCVAMAWKGEHITLKRVLGLAEYAQANGLKAPPPPSLTAGPRVPAKPKTDRDRRVEGFRARKAEIRRQLAEMGDNEEPTADAI